MKHLPTTPAAMVALALVAGGCGSEALDPRHVPPGAGDLLQQEPVSPGLPPSVRAPSGLVQAGSGPVQEARSWKADLGEPSGRFPFYWTRAVYSGYSRGWVGGNSWATDFPKGDRQFLVVLQRLVRLNAYDWENAVRLSDPDLRRFPVLYAVEVGYMDLTEAEVLGLRSYLDAGGFLIVDDFWGTREWDVFEHNMRRVFPDRPIVELEPDHPIFSAYYRIDEIRQVPARGNGIFGRGTYERDGFVPHVRGIFDDEGRLMVVVNWNTDLGDAWEWAEDPYYPLEYSTYAFEIGANMIVYAMSH